jgi:diguanylate cyclase (GGDEF)-like protein
MTGTPAPYGPAPQSDFEARYNFAREQEILGHALSRLEVIGDGSPCTGQEFAALVAEYGRLLQQARDAAGFADSMNQKILELKNLMQLDSLTGIHNRRYLEDNLDRIVKTLRRSGGELGVLMVDVDFFKQYNDIYGHRMGDLSLKKVAVALKKALSRADDFVARYGGEEFIVILSNTGEHGARLMAERMRASVRNCNIPCEYSGLSACVTVSVGATSGKVTPDRCGDDFIKLADEALYHAKNNGRNNSVFRRLSL